MELSIKISKDKYDSICLSTMDFNIFMVNLTQIESLALFYYRTTEDLFYKQKILTISYCFYFY